MRVIPDSELIINPDGSIYHLHLRPEHISDTIITVGDPGRVPDVSRHFDSIEHRIQNREFLIHTGKLGGKRLTVLSTGIGTDNMDIAMTELDALANIDFQTRTVKKNITSLTIIRLGTSGAVSSDIPLDSILISEAAIGIDNLMLYYRHRNTSEETALADAFMKHVHHVFPLLHPYVASADVALVKRFKDIGPRGITVTAPGFYGPQGRLLRAELQASHIISLLHRFRHQHYRITNLEMETSGLYALGEHLGHHCLSVSAIVAHRITNKFSADPQRTIDKMITSALEIFV
jgi:uridine phosphorylase